MRIMSVQYRAMRLIVMEYYLVNDSSVYLE